MGRAARHRRWGCGLLGLWCLCLPAFAQPHRVLDDAHLQVFSRISRSVLAVGTSLQLDVEVYASPGSVEAAGRVADAFSAARLDAAVEGLALARQEAMTTLSEGDPARPLVLARRFVFRARRSGLYHVPPLRLHLGGRTYATPEHPVTVYDVDPGFFKAGASVLPLVAEYEGVADGQRYVRVGSAFVAGLDAVVTSLHVVMDARRIVLTLPDGKRLTTDKAWVLDPVRDIAVLHVDARAVARAGLKPLRLAPVVGAVASPEEQEPDEAVAFTYGWPGGVQRSTAGVRYPGTTLQPGESLWVSANPVRPGDSGGPLLDRRGRVLGVVSSGAVNNGGHDVLREELCIALDPRPALGRKTQVRRPRSLKGMMRDPAFAAHPHMQAIRLMTMLSSGRRRIPDLEAVLARLDASRERAPDNARLNFLRGIIYQMLGTGDEAADAYRASLTAYDGHFLSAYMLGLHHLRRREYPAAERFFRRARQYPPYSHLAGYGIAVALMGRLQYAEAVPYLQAVVTHDPEYAPALYDLARCALALDDEPRARQLLARLETVSPVTAWRLRRVLREPVLQPVVLRERPLAPVSSLSSAR